MQNTITAGEFTVQILYNTVNAPPAAHARAISQYSFLIPNTYANFFQLPDNCEYMIVMGNNGPTKCDVTVIIDGEEVGIFRVESHGTISIERPTGVFKKFAFKNASNFQPVQDPSQDFQMPTNGKLSFTFKPEISKNAGVPSKQIADLILAKPKLDGKSGLRHDLNQEQFQPGATVLGNASTQTYVQNELIKDVDVNRQQTIEAYLVVKN